MRRSLFLLAGALIAVVAVGVGAALAGAPAGATAQCRAGTYDRGVNEYEGKDEPSPPGYVQVMTIHQAKGLAPSTHALRLRGCPPPVARQGAASLPVG